ncbi:hypothetical protein BN381_130357 [Candidatus Microthrix parvicella RN1]|uniref:Uncharacterized protein n=1 Tax=Candidatus Neomicrothrix parvicella RN1 TaxID=1229780 RepID=R4YX10_9ACTN|nr:hypothetical protein BN381_130357 [Candidatus Microthrix parvicella RN1]
MSSPDQVMGASTPARLERSVPVAYRWLGGECAVEDPTTRGQHDLTQADRWAAPVIEHRFASPTLSTRVTTPR